MTHDPNKMTAYVHGNLPASMKKKYDEQTLRQIFDAERTFLDLHIDNLQSCLCELLDIPYRAEDDKNDRVGMETFLKHLSAELKTAGKEIAPTEEDMRHILKHKNKYLLLLLK